ncbi:MAG: GNAT family N-acetyltransferase, partial [Actinomycetota bacterium]
MRIERFDPLAGPAALQACHEMFAAGLPGDFPGLPGLSLPSFTGWWACGFGAEPRETWLASVAGQPVGCYLLELPDQDNVTTGMVLPLVAPSQRRAGTGRDLLRHAAGRAARSGRTMLEGEAWA